MARTTAAPTPAQAARLRAKLAADARDHADLDRTPQFGRAVAEYAALPGGGPAAVRELACLHARGGDLAKALHLLDAQPESDPAARAAAFGHAADRAVRRRANMGLPNDLVPGYEAVVTAFERYEAGDDDTARAALEPVGLRSPFLEWKVLLRGLMAYSAGDDSRAAENWQRLSADRLPARLAAPLRAQIDAGFRAAQPRDTAARLAQQFRAVGYRGLVEPLEQLRGELGRDRPLTAAFRYAEAALPAIRRVAPTLGPALARCLYREVLDHGEPGDLPKYRRVFGAPPDDPDFHRLQGLAFERAESFGTANRHWTLYEKWLAGGPAGWPEPLVRRARALVLHRMGRNAAKADDDDGPDPLDLLFAPAKWAGKRPPSDPVPLFRRAAALAPDWPDPARELVNRLTASGDLPGAEDAARTLLDRTPAAVGVLGPLAAALQKAGRAADALALRQKALAANPLDKRTRALTAYAHLAAARRAVIDGDFPAADAALAAARDVCGDETPAGFHALRSGVARKLGRRDEADAERAAALAVPGGRLAATLFLAVDGALAKLKPADKRPADQALTAAWAAGGGPREANLLYAAWDQYHLEGVAYRGQPSQEKKIHALCLKAADADGAEADFELLAQGFAVREEWSLCLKAAAKLRERWPANPVFHLLVAEAEFSKGGGRPSRRVALPLKKARELAEASPEPRHRAVLDRVAKLETEVDPRDFFDFFFDRR